MTAADYMPIFLAETREQLQELNLAVVRLEAAREDRASREQIFRIAHSMKATSAAMGFTRMAALTHRMEDVFELVRQRRGPIQRQVVDVLLECLDALEHAIDAIDSRGSEDLYPDALIERLGRLVRARTPAQEAARAGGAVDMDELARSAAGARVLYVKTRLAHDAVMPPVRAYMVLAAAAEHGRILASRPSEELVESFAGNVIEAWIVSDDDTGAVAVRLERITDVAVADVVEHSAAAEQAPREPAPAEAPGRPRKGATTVRVDAARLDQLLDCVSAIDAQRAQARSLAARVGDPALARALADLDAAAQELQALVVQIRMIPVDSVFLRFPRLVRDLSARLGKKVELTLVGSDTEVDRVVADALAGPLVHLVRNALDHGLEPPDERLAVGKREAGTLELAARHEASSIVIEVRDDGRGIDPRAVATKAADAGLIAAGEVPSVEAGRATELLFAPGFSTVSDPTDLSGRGVGLDAVRWMASGLGGDVTLSSQPGAGTSVQIRIPVQLAMAPMMLVEAGHQSFAIPLEQVETTIALADHDVRGANGRRALSFGGGTLPLVDAASAFGASGSAVSGEHAVVVRAGRRRVALAVERLIGPRELITRAMAPGSELPGARAALLPGGDIARVADCDALEEVAA
jgi:two-component system chemotaxis sensor kinase CheA